MKGLPLPHAFRAKKKAPQSYTLSGCTATVVSTIADPELDAGGKTLHKVEVRNRWTRAIEAEVSGVCTGGPHDYVGGRPWKPRKFTVNGSSPSTRSVDKHVELPGDADGLPTTGHVDLEVSVRFLDGRPEVPFRFGHELQLR